MPAGCPDAGLPTTGFPRKSDVRGKQGGQDEMIPTRTNSFTTTSSLHHPLVSATMNAIPAEPATPPPQPPGSDRPRLALLLRRAWYGLNQTFRRRIAGMGVTPDQFTILRWLGEHPEGLTQRVLADLMASDPNTITAILTRMQKAGLIERRAHADDARCNLIVLKDKGRTVHAKLQPLASRLQEQLLAAVPPAKQAEFLAQLESVCTALDADDAAQPARKARRKT